jgi:hypothetical protein
MSELWDVINRYAENAPEAGFGPQQNFGLHTVTPYAVTWKDHKPTKTLLTGALPQGATLELTIEIDLKGMNPSLEFEYKRFVNVQKSKRNPDGTPAALTDWSETVLPSWEKVLGKDWAKKIGKPFYGCSESVPAVKSKTVKNKDTGVEEVKNFGVPALIAVYESKEQCLAAYQARYGKDDSSAVMAPDADTTEVSIPETVVAQVKGLIQSFGNNDKQLREVLASAFSAYDADTLITLAKK